MWTKKHDEFCLEIGLRPSSKLLYAWILRKTKGITTQEIEIDLRNFNQWIEKKRGKPFDRKTIKTAIAELLEKTQGLIVELKKITWDYYKIMVKPLSYLAQDKLPRIGKSPKTESTEPSWHRSSEDDRFKQQQQNISKIDNLLQEIGLRYDQAALNLIWRLSGKCIDKIVKAIELTVRLN